MVSEEARCEQTITARNGAKASRPCTATVHLHSWFPFRLPLHTTVSQFYARRLEIGDGLHIRSFCLLGAPVIHGTFEKKRQSFTESSIIVILHKQTFLGHVEPSERPMPPI